MSEKDRSKKKEKFKQTAKAEAAQQRIPRTHLVPVPTWQSNENLELRGDVLEVIEKKLYEAMESIQQIGQMMNVVLQQNIKAEKIKIDYVWNNGEKPTEAEVEAFKAEMERIKKQQQNATDQLKLQENFSKTGLVSADGEPIATTQDLDEPTADKAASDEQPSEIASESEAAE